MTGLPALRMGFSDLSGPFCLDDGFVAATSSNIEIGGKGSAQWHSSFLNMGRCVSVKGSSAVFGSASCWKKRFQLGGLRSGHTGEASRCVPFF